MKKFSRLNVQDYDLSRVQDAIGYTLDPITESKVIDGQLLENIQLIAGQDNVIAHRLGRKPLMWSVADISASATVWRLGNFDKNYLTLRCSSDVTVSIWVA